MSALLRCALAALAVAAVAAVAPSAATALPFVAIDPGHGGADTGAVGRLPAGTVTGLPPRTDSQGRPLLYEKDVNLDVSHRLNAWLRARGARTMMTRTGDTGAGGRPYTTARADLRARTDMANEAGAHVFVSVHNNALSATSAGTETFHFYYSSAAARGLAREVHREMVAALGLPDRGVKTAGFYVLRHTVMPAILVEGAFLTNPSEALLLADPAFRQRMAAAIGRGVRRFSGRGVQAPPRLPPMLGPWQTRPRSVPDGYRLVRTGTGSRLGGNRWIAVVEGFRQEAPPRPATLGPWGVRPRAVPPGYRLVRTGRNNPVGRGGWIAVLEGAQPAARR